MSPSKTKKRILHGHLENKLLQAPILMPMPLSYQDLSTDHPTLQPDPSILASAANALEQGQTHYVDVPGIMPLREKLADYLKEMGLKGYDAENVLVTAGVQECRFLLIQVIGESFGSIGLPEVVHPGAQKAAGLRHINVRTLPVDPEDGMLSTLAGIQQALKDGCKLLYLESPVRLTGAIYDRNAVEEIARLVRQADAAVIWDQGLAPWVHEPGYVSLGSQPDVAERVAVFGEAWPGTGLESWFIGYIALNPVWMEGVRSQKQIISICTSTPSQYAALRAAEIYDEVHREQVEKLGEYQRQTLETVHMIQAKRIKGATVNLLALQVSEESRIEHILREAGFTVAAGRTFGALDVLRFSVTFDNMSTQALAQLVP